MLRSMKEQDYGEIRCFKNFVRKVHLEMKIKNIHPTSAQFSDTLSDVRMISKQIMKQDLAFGTQRHSRNHDFSWKSSFLTTLNLIIKSTKKYFDLFSSDLDSTPKNWPRTDWWKLLMDKNISTKFWLSTCDDPSYNGPEWTPDR